MNENINIQAIENLLNEVWKNTDIPSPFLLFDGTEWDLPFATYERGTLICSDGTRVKLSLIERMMCEAGYADLCALDRRYNSEPRQ